MAILDLIPFWVWVVTVLTVLGLWPQSGFGNAVAGGLFAAIFCTSIHYTFVLFWTLSFGLFGVHSPADLPLWTWLVIIGLLIVGAVTKSSYNTTTTIVHRDDEEVVDVTVRKK